MRAFTLTYCSYCMYCFCFPTLCDCFCALMTANDMYDYMSHKQCLYTIHTVHVPWKSKTKQRMFFTIFHVKNKSILPKCKVWSLDFLLYSCLTNQRLCILLDLHSSSFSIHNSTVPTLSTAFWGHALVLTWLVEVILIDVRWNLSQAHLP